MYIFQDAISHIKGNATIANSFCLVYHLSASYPVQGKETVAHILLGSRKTTTTEASLIFQYLLCSNILALQAIQEFTKFSTKDVHIPTLPPHSTDSNDKMNISGCI